MGSTPSRQPSAPAAPGPAVRTCRCMTPSVSLYGDSTVRWGLRGCRTLAAMAYVTPTGAPMRPRSRVAVGECLGSAPGFPLPRIVPRGGADSRSRRCRECPLAVAALHFHGRLLGLDQPSSHLVRGLRRRRERVLRERFADAPGFHGSSFSFQSLCPVRWCPPAPAVSKYSFECGFSGCVGAPGSCACAHWSVFGVAAEAPLQRFRHARMGRSWGRARWSWWRWRWRWRRAPGFMARQGPGRRWPWPACGLVAACVGGSPAPECSRMFTNVSLPSFPLRCVLQPRAPAADEAKPVLASDGPSRPHPAFLRWGHGRSVTSDRVQALGGWPAAGHVAGGQRRTRGQASLGGPQPARMDAFS